MKERGILMSAPMVRALLSGTKTQTRRLFKDTVSSDCIGFVELPTDERGQWRQRFNGGVKAWTHRCPHGSPKDTIWVRETWAENDPPSGWMYRADDLTDYYEASGLVKWKPSIFMPRRASRITLEIESVRVERLQDISEEDAKAEGVELPPCTYLRNCRSNSCPRHGRLDRWNSAYRLLWESINGKGSWALNPWVWVITFRRLA